ACRGQPLESGPHHPLSIYDENPRLGLQVPLHHRGEERVCRGVLPDLLVREDDPITICREERPYDIHHWPADSAGAERRRGKHDDLRLALRDRIRDADLMQSWIRGIARVDLAQVLHVAGDQVVAARRWGAWRRGAGGCKDVDAESRHLDWPVHLPGKHF